MYTVQPNYYLEGYKVASFSVTKGGVKKHCHVILDLEKPLPENLGLWVEDATKQIRAAFGDKD